MGTLKWKIVNEDISFPKEHSIVMPVHLKIDGGWVIYEGKRVYCEKQLDLSPVAVNIARIVMDDGTRLVVPGWKISPVNFPNEPYLVEPSKFFANWDIICGCFLDSPLMDWRGFGGCDLEIQLAARLDLPMARIHSRFWAKTFRQIYYELDGKLDKNYLFEFTP